jgi:hypothetical protein
MNTLKDSALEGWEICNGCQLVFCIDCKNQADEEEMCPGSVYFTEHKSYFTLLPVEQIMDLAEDFHKDPKEGKYIRKLFYEDEKKKIDLVKGEENTHKNEDYRMIRFREEQWRKFGTVLVKRKDGKFLTWGQIE